MPNHVATNLTLDGDMTEIRSFLEQISKEDGSGFDFSLLLPMPEQLRGTQSPMKIVSLLEYAEALRDRAARLAESPDGLVPGHPLTQEMSDDLKKKYGADNWYDWMHTNYGTKWGMYEVSSREEGAFFYMTAWSPATEYYLRVSKKFPSIVFRHEFADEGGGFVGYESIQNGAVIESIDVGWDSEEGILIRQSVGYYHDEDEDYEEDEA